MKGAVTPVSALLRGPLKRLSRIIFRTCTCNDHCDERGIGTERGARVEHEASWRAAAWRRPSAATQRKRAAGACTFTHTRCVVRCPAVLIRGRLRLRPDGGGIAMAATAFREEHPGDGEGERLRASPLAHAPTRVCVRRTTERTDRRAGAARDGRGLSLWYEGRVERHVASSPPCPRG